MGGVNKFAINIHTNQIASDITTHKKSVIESYDSQINKINL